MFRYFLFGSAPRSRIAVARATLSGAGFSRVEPPPALAGPELVARLNARTAAYGVGRNIHLGETALGIKGRVGFEAGAALVLIAAHRELEKLVLTKWQQFWKDQLGRFYGDRLHEGHYFDPALRDIEALFTASQRRVLGATRARLAPGRFLVTGTRSPHSLMDPAVATYGEEPRLWTGAEARAFARIGAIPDLLAARAGGKAEEAGSEDGGGGGDRSPFTVHRSPP